MSAVYVMIRAVAVIGLLYCRDCAVASADEPRVVSDYVFADTVVAIGGVSERPLRWSNVHRWDRILDVSEPQLEFMRLQYEQHVLAHNQTMDVVAPTYLRMAADLARLWDESGITPEYARLQRRMNQESRRLRQQLTSLEHEFIASIEPILTPEQRERTIVLRYESMRRNCRLFPRMTRWMEVELREIWHASTDSLTSPREREVVNAILLEHEIRLTSLECRHSDLELDRLTLLVDTYVSSDEPGVLMPREGLTVSEAHARLSRHQGRSAENVRSIRILYEDAIRRIASNVSSEVTAALVTAVRNTVFRELYPDRHAVHDVFEAILTDPNIDQSTRRSIAECFAAYKEKYRQYCDELEAFCADWDERVIEGSRDHQPAKFRAELDRRLNERVRLSGDWLQRLENLVEEETIQQHKELPADER